MNLSSATAKIWILLVAFGSGHPAYATNVETSSQFLVSRVASEGKSVVVEFDSLPPKNGGGFRTRVIDRDGIPTLFAWMVDVQSGFFADPKSQKKAKLSDSSKAAKLLAKKLRSIALKVAVEEKNWSLSGHARSLAQHAEVQGAGLTHGWVAANLNPWFLDVFQSRKYRVLTFELSPPGQKKGGEREPKKISDAQSTLLGEETLNPLLKRHLSEILSLRADNESLKPTSQLASMGLTPSFEEPKFELAISVSPKVLKELQTELNH